MKQQLCNSHQAVTTRHAGHLHRTTVNVMPVSDGSSLFGHVLIGLYCASYTHYRFVSPYIYFSFFVSHFPLSSPFFPASFFCSLSATVIFLCSHCISFLHLYFVCFFVCVSVCLCFDPTYRQQSQKTKKQKQKNSINE